MSIDVERVHAVADLVELVTADGTVLRRVGNELHGACPLCACSNASRRHRCDRFRINADRSHWYCRQCSPRGGDAIAFVEQRYALSFVEACEVIVGYRLLVPAQPALARVHKVSEASTPLSGQTLQTVDEAKPLPRLRSLLGSRAADYLVEQRRIPLAVALQAGVGWCERFGRVYLAFPFVDASGTVIAHQYRATTPQRPKHDTQGPKGDGVFVVGSFEAQTAIALCEAPLDALSLALTGVAAVALGGVGCGPDWHWERLRGRHVLVASDADDAGGMAADCWAERLDDAIFERLRPPEACKDWNEVLVRYGVAALRSACRWSAQQRGIGNDPW